MELPRPFNELLNISNLNILEKIQRINWYCDEIKVGNT
jgi:hypothetical protein